MKMQPVDSEAIRAIGYDDATRKLTVAFHSGSTWEYDNVAPHQHQALLAADSIGKHFHQKIRGTFKGREVK